MAKEGALLSTTKILLQCLAEVGGIGVDFFNLIYDVKFHRGWYVKGGHSYVLEMKKLQQEKYAKMTLNQLRRSNYVKASYLGNKLIVSLTAKGWNHTLATKLRYAPKSKYGYTVVIFDVPQSQNEARRQFRLLLKQGGFIRLQQSVWISTGDNYLTLKDFIKKLKLESWVNVFYGTNFLSLPR